MDRAALLDRFRRVRARTERLLAPCSEDDLRIQSMPDVSPPYWTLGHTSWFFVANVLRPAKAPFPEFAGFDYAFNSYYEGLGPRLPKAQRGSVAQPGNDAVREYRRAVDAAMLELLLGSTEQQLAGLLPAVIVGLEHEEQHQELLLTEILHIRAAAGPELRRAYALPAPTTPPARGGEERPLHAVAFPGGAATLGHDGDGFCWDNELPPHRVHVGECALGDRLITNAEWRAFVDDGGYRRPLLWLSNGWNAVQQHGWHAPLYWERDGDRWCAWTLRGLAELDPTAPVCHVSFYEADAFARWYGEQFAAWRHARLPRESEWEHAARTFGFDQARGNLLDDEPATCALAVLPARGGASLQQLAGDVWEWTQSHYEPYPGYRPFAGALMEYNGKFMDNQRVLRGGSFATPRSQARACYRNFWPAHTRFQATGVRLLVDR
jgi:ergothioneine biosynthesis protein EgtB